MMKKLIRPAIGFAIAIAIVLAFGGLFRVYTVEVLSQEKQDEVLIKAIPFVAVFVSIVLAFVYVIVAAAILLNGKVPRRSYRPIEGIIIAGIVLGVVGLFQGWKLFAYEYGFLLLLASTLAFMIWSHLSPMTLRESQEVPPLTQRAHVIGVVAGVIVWAAIAGFLIIGAEPKEPYGISSQIWELMMDDQEKADTADQAEDDYYYRQIPVFILVSMMAGGITYLGTREIVAARGHEVPRGPQPPVQTEPAEVSNLTPN